MKKPRVLVLFDTDTDPPANQDYTRHLASGVDEVEFEVAKTLRERGYEVRLLGFRNDIDQLIAGIRAEPVDVVFNLTERFKDLSSLDYTVAGLLEMLGVPYTGAGPTGLILARHKALTKMVLAHHDVRTPRFIEIEPGNPCKRPSDLRFPLIVKPVDEDASVGIARASVVRDDQALSERVTFIHDRFKTAAIVEEFIAGREIYVGVVGNEDPKALPPIEMVFEPAVPDERRIATFKVKWSHSHRERMGVQNRIATDLSPEVLARLHAVAIASYKAASLRDYGRVDVRLAHDHEIYVVEANPNPYLSEGEDMSWAAEEGGYPYPELLEAIVEWAYKRGSGRSKA
ncbi:MAG TPA: D-alanine--D-alanine ligase [Polyangia bacterium]